ncbi:unnamed protein product, partial [Laminaria digitata]
EGVTCFVFHTNGKWCEVLYLVYQYSCTRTRRLLTRIYKYERRSNCNESGAVRVWYNLNLGLPILNVPGTWYVPVFLVPRRGGTKPSTRFHSTLNSLLPTRGTMYPTNTQARHGAT